MLDAGLSAEEASAGAHAARSTLPNGAAESMSRSKPTTPKTAGEEMAAGGDHQR